MQLATILLTSSLVLELGLGVGLILLWRRSGPSSEKSEESFKRMLQGEMDRFERYLDGKVDLLLAHLADLQAPDSGSQEEASGQDEGPATEDLADWRPPQNLRPRAPGRSADLSEAELLDILLSDQDFTSGIWPRMDGEYQVATAHLLGFLSGQGVAEPGVEPHPPTAFEDGNHWDFLVVWSEDAGGDGCRFLIPRNYSRYDPALHDHLFQVRGGGPGLDNFIQELRQCAVLRGSGPIEGLIRSELVERKGELVV